MWGIRGVRLAYSGVHETPSCTVILLPYCQSPEVKEIAQAGVE
jgi:hypothetical protein